MDTNRDHCEWYLARVIPREVVKVGLDDDEYPQSLTI